MSPERRAHHDHGTWQRYARKGNNCRCTDCREAWRIYRATQNKAVAYGRATIDHYVDAGPAREHLNQLRAEGCGQKSIARITGVAPMTVYRVCSGAAARIRTSTNERLMAATITPDLMLDRAKIDGTGTRRRIHALVAMGWTMSRLARRLDCTPENVRQIASAANGHRVTVGLHRSVTALYDALWNVPPRLTSPAQRGAALSAKRMAARNGWHGPLAWDDDTIDDPAAEPYAETRPTGARAATETAEEVADYLEHVDPYATASHLAERLGYRDVTGVQQALKRADRPDLLAQLARNAHIASNVTGRTA